MSDERVEAFLKAEKEAVGLVETLETLKREVGSYRDAGAALGKSSDAIDRCALKLGEVADQAVRVVTTLREIGTPAILNGIDEIKKQAAEGSRATKRLERRINIAIVLVVVGFLAVAGILLFHR